MHDEAAFYRNTSILHKMTQHALLVRKCVVVIHKTYLKCILGKVENEVSQAKICVILRRFMHSTVSMIYRHYMLVLCKLLHINYFVYINSIFLLLFLLHTLNSCIYVLK